MDNNIIDNIDFFINYMKSVKNASDNTLQSYKRDMHNMAKYFYDQGISDVSKINSTNINSYILYLEREGKSAATIARCVSSIKTFFRCMINNGAVKREPTENLQTPQNDHKKTAAITEDDINKILSQISGNGSKEQRDRAMLMLMVDTGIKVSELIEIKTIDVNLQYAYVTCHGRKKDKTIRFSNNTLTSLKKYIEEARVAFVKNEDTDVLFLNCFGRKMSRQGFWKMFKEYASMAGVEGVTTHAIHK